MSFVDVSVDSGFTLSNLPFGVCQLKGADGPARHICVRLGDHAVDLHVLQNAGCFSGPVLSKSSCFGKDTLNEFLGLGKPAWQEARQTLQRLLSSSEGQLRDNDSLRHAAIIPLSDVTMCLPAAIGDYTDFYASKHHAYNVGCLFRSPEKALEPNWVQLPVGYHGRSSSIVVSGTDVHRPRGQVLAAGQTSPEMAPSRAVDFELEMACVMGSGNELGTAVPVDRAADAIFGLVMMNDWSARDIQKWEYVPLGPFNGKNWSTQISPWIVTLDALAPFQCPASPQSPPVLPYLQESIRHSYDINLTAAIAPEGAAPGEDTVVTTTNLKHMYWTFPQMVAHHTLGGCNLRPGDLLGSGTISGPQEDSRACLLEITRGGSHKINIKAAAGGKEEWLERAYLQDGDTVVFRGFCEKEGVGKVGFGECRGKLLPPK